MDSQCEVIFSRHTTFKNSANNKERNKKEILERMQCNKKGEREREREKREERKYYDGNHPFKNTKQIKKYRVYIEGKMGWYGGGSAALNSSRVHDPRRSHDGRDGRVQLVLDINRKIARNGNLYGVGEERFHPVRHRGRSKVSIEPVCNDNRHGSVPTRSNGEREVDDVRQIGATEALWVIQQIGGTRDLDATETEEHHLDRLLKLVIAVEFATDYDLVDLIRHQ